MKKFLYTLVLFYRFFTGKVKHYQSGIKKARIPMLSELTGWMIREGEFNKMYYAYGLNIAGTRSDKFIGRKTFLSIKDKVEKNMKERVASSSLNYDILTKDKYVSNSFLKSNGIACIENLALIRDSKIIFSGGEPEPIDNILSLNRRVVIKNIVLEAGDGILVCDIADNNLILNEQPCNIEEFKKKLGTAVWVLQEAIRSHDRIRVVNSSALNTTRIVTILDGRQPIYLTGFQSFATNKATTDSWSRGSVYVGLDMENYCLKEFGYFNLDLKDKGLVTEHPDSKIVFRNYSIPFLKDAVELCLKAHNLFYFNFIIGWDVAITNEGPLIVEANEKPGLNAVQCLDGGLRYSILQHAKKYLMNE